MKAFWSFFVYLQLVTMALVAFMVVMLYESFDSRHVYAIRIAVCILCGIASIAMQSLLVRIVRDKHREQTAMVARTQEARVIDMLRLAKQAHKIKDPKYEDMREIRDEMVRCVIDALLNGAPVKLVTDNVPKEVIEDVVKEMLERTNLKDAPACLLELFDFVRLTEPAPSDGPQS